MDKRVYYNIINMGYNVLLFYIRLWTTSDIIQRHYYLPRNIIYSNKTKHKRGNKEQNTYLLVKWWRLLPNPILMHSLIVLFFHYVTPLCLGL